jgi:hypothetical protein
MSAGRATARLLTCIKSRPTRHLQVPASESSSRSPTCVSRHPHGPTRHQAAIP